MPNIYDADLSETTEYRRARVGEDAGAVQLGMSKISVYPDTNEVGIFDAPLPGARRFGALFNVDDAVSDYGGGRARIVPPA